MGTEDRSEEGEIEEKEERGGEGREEENRRREEYSIRYNNI